MTVLPAERLFVLTLGLLVVVALLPAGPGAAVLISHSQAQPQEPPAGEVTIGAQRELARRLHRVAEDVIRAPRQSEEVPPHALLRAETMIAFALERDADDEIGWRRRAELARLQGDDEALRDALRAIVRLDPRDDAALYEFILLRFAEIPTVDGRLNRVERLLRSRRASDLSDALRSRLASYASRLALEIQDRERFARWLTEALRLDAHNVLAADMLHDFARQRNAPEAKQLSAVVSLIAATPLRPEPRLELALALARHAAYEEAHEQFAIASDLFSPRALPTDAYRLWILSLSAQNRLEEAREQLDQLAAPAAFEAAAAGASDASESAEDAARGGAVAGGAVAGDAAASDAANENAAQGDAMQGDAADGEPGDSGDAASEPELDRAGRLGRIDPQLLVLDAVVAEPGSQRRLRCFAALSRLILETADDNRDAAIDQIARIAAALDAETLDALDAEVRQAVRRRPLYQAFEAMREGEDDRAAEWIGPLVEVGEQPLADYLAARLDAGRRSAERAMRAVIRSAPTSLAALFAGQWLTTRAEDISPTSVGAALRQMMNRQPRDLWRMNLDTSPWIDLHMAIPDDAFGPFDAVPATITLRNDSDMRLTFDPGAAIPARAVLRVSLNPGERGGGRLEPDVIDLDRRLALDPGQELAFVWPLSRGALGDVITRKPFTSYIFNTRLIADPRTLRDGRVVMGPLGDRADVRGRLARGVEADAAELVRTAEALGAGVSVNSLHDAAILVSALQEGSGVELTGPQRAAIAAALGDHAAAAGDAALAWLLCVIPRGETLGLDRVWQLAQRSETPLVQCLLLERHVDDPEDPVMSQVIRNGGDRAEAYARTVRESLEAAADPPEQP